MARKEGPKSPPSPPKAPRPKAPAPKRSKGAQKKGGHSILPVLLALVLPAVAVGGYVLFRSSPETRESVTQVWNSLTSKVRTNQKPQPQEPPKRTDPRRAEPQVIQKSPENAVVPERESPAAPISTPRPGLRPLPEVAPEVAIPRQQAKPAHSTEAAIRVKSAAELASSYFSGKAEVKKTTARSPWYEFTLSGGKSRAPFRVRPVDVSVSTRVLQGPFKAGQEGFVALLRVTDPAGPEETSTVVGAVLFSGTPDQPGKVQSSVAMEAPQGTVTRLESLDFQKDGTLELVLEVESQAPGGYLFRDLLVASLATHPALVLWSARTLDDGPGALVESATFRQVSFEDEDRDGRVDILEVPGERQYRIQKDLSRTRLSEKLGKQKIYRLRGNRFKVARQ